MANREENNGPEKKKLAPQQIAGDIGQFAVTAAGKAKDLTAKSQQAILGAVDQNHNGQIDIEDVILMGLRVPGIRIDRAAFLQKELANKLPQQTIDEAIASCPLRAGVPPELIDSIADEVIKYERTCVSGISAALGIPGGFAMAATIPADIAQYYGYLLRATQKLMYLYGFPAINFEETEQTFDSATLNTLIVCMGVMYGVAGANNALKAMAKALATGVEKQLLRQALTKGTIYPIVKNTAKWFGVKMTKDIFAGFFKKAIPVVGGVLGGGITYLSFKPCCDRLQSSLRSTMLSMPDYQETEEDTLQYVDAEPCEDSSDE